MKYAIGIDLGTTNTEMAYCRLDGEGGSTTFDVPQFVAPSVIESRFRLPSFLYIGSEEERVSSSWKLPWDEDDDFDPVSSKSSPARDEKSGKKGFLERAFGLGTIFKKKLPEGLSNPNALYLVGEIASSRIVTEPERTVASAKSWLTATRVDRRSPILPWNSPDGCDKVSPVEASRRYLSHLVAAWNNSYPDAPISEQLVVLTVPASFDESARELTRESAMGAGLNPDSLLFLEEPQAALYAWLAEKGDQWREDLKVGDVVFVCDIGGGTTDLSMIRVEEEEGDLVLRRLAVGRRLLLGGDNIDLALAYKASELFAREGIKLDPWQSTSLQRQCRLAKEKFLKGETTVADDALKITIAGRSSRAIAGAVSIDLPEKDAVSIILDGFFPICSLEDRPKARSVMGLREIGLPYESDPAFSRHIARFLSSCLDENGEPIAPTHFLLNGGVFRASLARKRFQEQLSVWFPQNEPRDLSPDADLERAVSRGAAYYGAMKQIGGVRIRSASARSYYVGIEVAGLAVPGATLPLKLLCIVPQGMEEGTEILASSDEFELVVGETAIFRFFSSTSRTRDKPGDVFLWREENDESDFEETDPIETILELDSSTLSDASNESFVTVRFRSVLTELGVLEIWCDETNGSRSWKLEFSVREERRS